MAERMSVSERVRAGRQRGTGIPYPAILWWVYLCCSVTTDHWVIQMSFHVGMPSVLSSLSPLIFDPWAWAIPV